ncbi:MAG: ComEC/Rec2 family competence protein [Candidatus Beckwithbacteria bacterium]|nr:ComEC/Rec2 family competence protein [Candidatus Beckwithbacteria bacterium]
MRGVLVCLIWFAIFLVRFSNSFQGEAKLRHLAGEKIVLTGYISSEPILQGINQKFSLSRIDIVTANQPNYEYGQKVVISGILQRRVINKWYSQFSLIYPSIKIIESDNIKSIRYQIIRWRKGIETVFNRNLPEPEASLLAGIILGVKRGLPQEFYEALKKTSTMHIVVASGYNVTVIMGVVVAYLAGLAKRKWAILIGVAAVGIYTVMAGLQPAIVRAAIMGGLAYFGQMLGRPSASWRMLVVAAMVMLIFDPLIIFDLGFQMSFSATTGLIVLGSKLDKIFGRIWLIGKDLSETTAAQIFVSPIILSAFGYLSPFSILVNISILWLVPIIMVLGAILAITRLSLVAWLAYVPLTIMVRIIEFFNR